jgi:hypothetical protein
MILASSLEMLAAQVYASEPQLVYRTDAWGTSAVGYDSENDSVVELAQLGPYGPSVLRRVSRTCEPAGVIWQTEGETLCPAECGVGLEFSKILDGYIILANVGTSRYQTASVYFASRDGKERLLARNVVQPTADYPDRDMLEPASSVSGSSSRRSWRPTGSTSWFTARRRGRGRLGPTSWTWRRGE